MTADMNINNVNSVTFQHGMVEGPDKNIVFPPVKTGISQPVEDNSVNDAQKKCEGLSELFRWCGSKTHVGLATLISGLAVAGVGCSGWASTVAACLGPGIGALSVGGGASGALSSAPGLLFMPSSFACMPVGAGVLCLSSYLALDKIGGLSGAMLCVGSVVVGVALLALVLVYRKRQGQQEESVSAQDNQGANQQSLLDSQRGSGETQGPVEEEEGNLSNSQSEQDLPPQTLSSPSAGSSEQSEAEQSDFGSQDGSSETQGPVEEAEGSPSNSQSEKDLPPQVPSPPGAGSSEQPEAEQSDFGSQGGSGETQSPVKEKEAEGGLSNSQSEKDLPPQLPSSPGAGSSEQPKAEQRDFGFQGGSGGTQSPVKEKEAEGSPSNSQNGQNLLPQTPSSPGAGSSEQPEAEQSDFGSQGLTEEVEVRAKKEEAERGLSNSQSEQDLPPQLPSSPGAGSSEQSEAEQRGSGSQDGSGETQSPVKEKEAEGGLSNSQNGQNLLPQTLSSPGAGSSEQPRSRAE